MTNWKSLKFTAFTKQNCDDFGISTLFTMMLRQDKSVITKYHIVSTFKLNGFVITFCHSYSLIAFKYIEDG